MVALVEEFGDTAYGLVRAARYLKADLQELVSRYRQGEMIWSNWAWVSMAAEQEAREAIEQHRKDQQQA